MLKANGQNPTPRMSPFCVSLRLNSVCHSPMTCARTTKPKAQVTSAMKQPQKRRELRGESGFMVGPRDARRNSKWQEGLFERGVWRKKVRCAGNAPRV